MPREDVPYPSRALCSLKCQIDALNNKINELMKSINGVQGDGQGDLSLVSGDAAIVINNDAAQHEVEISLDQSQLPAAAVSSVNGQTGIVDLDSSDIPMVSGVPTPTVNNKIGAIEGNVTQLQLDLTQEVTDRGNADSTLQTNINAANAAITGKVDKLTTAGDHAYTHNGSTQGETPVVDGTTADTIPIRDANGRMQAADPASGATDKTLVTANWVSQTGDSAPNNLIHRSGNETKTGYFGFQRSWQLRVPNLNGWVKIAESDNDIRVRRQLFFEFRMNYYNNNHLCYGKIAMLCYYTSGTPVGSFYVQLNKSSTAAVDENSFIMAANEITGKWELWVQMPSNEIMWIRQEDSTSGTITQSAINASFVESPEVGTEPAVGDTYSRVYYGTLIQ